MTDDRLVSTDTTEAASGDLTCENPERRKSKIRPVFAVIGAIISLGLVFAGMNDLMRDGLETSKSFRGVILAFSGLISFVFYVRWVRRPPMR